MTDISRRKFIQLSVIGGAVAASGCSPRSRYNSEIYRSEWAGQYGGYDDRVEPYVDQPDGLQDGVPQYFATTCRMCPAGCGLFVRTMGGRAVKIEGNPDHPVNAGRTCPRGQAALQQLYNPGRLRYPRQRASRSAAWTEQRDWNIVLAELSQQIEANKDKIAIIADSLDIRTSPTLSKALNDFAGRHGAALVSFGVLDLAPNAFPPVYRLDEADCLLAFSSNFLEVWPSPVLYGRQFGEFRQGPRRVQGEHGKFVYIGPRMSMTAAKADRWIPCAAGAEGAIAGAILASLKSPGFDFGPVAAATGAPAEWLKEASDAFRAAGDRALAMSGDILLSYPNGGQAAAAIDALNRSAGSRCVGSGGYALAPPSPSASGYAAVSGLIDALNAGRFGMVLLAGQPNPVYALPQAAGFAAALAKAPFIAALTAFEDETTAGADLLLPIRTFLEDWGDNVPLVPAADTRIASLQQPIIDPAFVGGVGLGKAVEAAAPWMDTRPLLSILADVDRRTGAGAATPAAQPTGQPPAATAQPTDVSRDAVRASWAAIGKADLKAESLDDDTAWVDALANGGVWLSVPGHGMLTAGTPLPAPATPIPTPEAPPPGRYSLQVYPHLYRQDGRHANLPWMQEIPDPMTAAVWNSWVEINRETAYGMGIKTGDIVRVTSDHGSIELPALPYPAIHPGVVAIPLGQGHGAYGKYAAQGANPLAILDPVPNPQTGALALQGTTVTIAKVRDAREMDLVTVQDRPHGQEPDAVKDLIHTTAREWKQAHPVTEPPAEGNIFVRKGRE